MRDEREINFFDVIPKNRDYSNPVTSLESEILGRFGKEYFESPFTHRYHGYEYNGSYANGAERMIDYFGLQPAAKVLDVGCAKGFLLHDFFKHNSSLKLYGIDVSKYALDNAMDLTQEGGAFMCKRCFIAVKDNQFDIVL